MQSLDGGQGSLDQANPAQQTDKRPRLAFLDGIRGISALYIVLFHIVAGGDAMLSADNWLLNLLRFGPEAVVVFFVLSGFVNALPAARSAQLGLPGGASGFLGRRARRLLPAYYVALLIVPIFMIASVLLGFITGKGADWSLIRELYFGADMLSHLFLVHNLAQSWAFSINPALWAMSTLFWTYVLFALVLWPVWRRFGVGSATCVGIVLGLLPAVVSSLGGPILFVGFHMFAAFGLGMASAALLYGPKGTVRPLPYRRAFMWAARLSAVVYLCLRVIEVWIGRDDTLMVAVKDLALAVPFSVYICLACFSVITGQWKSYLARALARFFESRPLVFLGRISYSLYLSHLAVWQVMQNILESATVKQRLGWSLDALPMRLLVAIPIILASAYGFYLLFEKPFLHRRSWTYQPSTRSPSANQTA